MQGGREGGREGGRKGKREIDGGAVKPSEILPPSLPPSLPPLPSLLTLVFISLLST